MVAKDYLVELEFKFMWEFFSFPKVSTNVGVQRQERVEQ
jgi:hypothetical protein